MFHQTTPQWVFVSDNLGSIEVGVGILACFFISYECHFMSAKYYHRNASFNGADINCCFVTIYSLAYFYMLPNGYVLLRVH